jgi:rhodanese-related sulfurtransferase
MDDDNNGMNTNEEVTKEADGIQRRYEECMKQVQHYHSKFTDVPTLTSQQLIEEKATNNRKVVLVDVRTQEERSVGYIPDSITLEEFTEQQQAQQQQGADDKDTIVVTYCTVGYRSGIEAQKISKKYPCTKVYNLDGILAYTFVENAPPLISQTKNDDVNNHMNTVQATQIHVYGKKWDYAHPKYEPVWFENNVDGIFGRLTSLFSRPSKKTKSNTDATTTATTNQTNDDGVDGDGSNKRQSKRGKRRGVHEREPRQDDRQTQEPLPSSVFTMADDEFCVWMEKEIHQTCDSALKEKYPDVVQKLPVVITKWRKRFTDRQAIWKRIFDKDRVIKECIEAIPVLDTVHTYIMEEYDQQKLQGGQPEPPYTIIDLCSGKGYLSMILSEMLPPSMVESIVLMDKSWPMNNETSIQKHHINWDHVYSTSSAAWPIPLITSKQDLKSKRQLDNICHHYSTKNGHRVIMLAIHLCGTLSIKAVQMFNTNPAIKFLALKPCCLPGMVHAKRHEVFVLGSHEFDSKDVCIHGKWKRNQWVGGPPRSHIKERFQVWSSHLYCGIIENDNEECDRNKDDDTATTTDKEPTETPTKASATTSTGNIIIQKMHCRIMVQNQGGFQNDFLFAQRPLSSSDGDATTSNSSCSAIWEKLQQSKVAVVD